MTELLHVELAREATAAGLTVTHLMPHMCRCGGQPEVEYAIQLWAAADELAEHPATGRDLYGRLWAEGTHESAEMVRRHIAGYRRRTAATRQEHGDG